MDIKMSEEKKAIDPKLDKSPEIVLTDPDNKDSPLTMEKLKSDVTDTGDPSIKDVWLDNFF